jgi:putative membrane protein insertion efficiency factor
MVFIGGWRTGRPRGPYYPYGRRSYGYGNNSCLRDLCLIETGCCLAESFGCGPQLTLLAPQLVRRSVRAARLGQEPGTRDTPNGRGVGFLLAAIRTYQQEISAKRQHRCCRFSPSCSAYAYEALERHGLRAGLALSVRRLLRCRPGARGGDDPVPPTHRG